jgi:hypothetical protein
MHVVDDDSHAVFGHPDPVAMQKRARGVLVPLSQCSRIEVPEN